MQLYSDVFEQTIRARASCSLFLSQRELDARASSAQPMHQRVRDQRYSTSCHLLDMLLPLSYLAS